MTASVWPASAAAARPESSPTAAVPSAAPVARGAARRARTPRARAPSRRPQLAQLAPRRDVANRRITVRGGRRSRRSARRARPPAPRAPRAARCPCAARARAPRPTARRPVLAAESARRPPGKRRPRGTRRVPRASAAAAALLVRVSSMPEVGGRARPPPPEGLRAPRRSGARATSHGRRAPSASACATRLSASFSCRLARAPGSRRRPAPQTPPPRPGDRGVAPTRVAPDPLDRRARPSPAAAPPWARPAGRSRSSPSATRARVAPRRLLLHRLADDDSSLVGASSGVERARGGGSSRSTCQQHPHGGVGVEGRAPGEQLVEAWPPARRRRCARRSGAPRACSGDMYAGVPITPPVRVSVVPPGIERAIPKSVTQTWSSLSSAGCAA